MEVSAAGQLALLIVLGISVQWLATMLRLPSILFLLATGVVVGPVLDLVHPEELFGELLFPAVALAVGILLFEGGLSLRFDQFRDGRTVLLRLVTLGVLVTWVLASAAVYLLVDVGTAQAVLIGSILTVSGPTVVIPLLRLARPREPLGSILRWEGILIDPVGATLAIVVLNAVLEDTSAAGSGLRVLETSVAGIGAGVLVAVLLVEVLRRHWVPDHLQNSVTLLALVGAFALANVVRPEAGLFATTVLGVALANQRRVPVRHIREFEENLGALILASLFVVLGALVDLDALGDYLAPTLGVVAVLVVVARPLVAFLSTIGSALPRADRTYVALMAPRGIVAAAVATVFSLELEEAGRPADAVIPVVFLVILFTVALYGLAAVPAARRLRVARAEPTGVAFIGGRPWALDLADRLATLDVPVLVVATTQGQARRAAERGLLAFSGRLDSEDLFVAIEGAGVRAAVAVSPTEELNAFGIGRLADVLGRAHLYHVPVDDGELGAATERAVQGRRAFGASITQPDIEARLADGGRFAVFDEGEALPPDALAVFSVDADGRPEVSTGAVRPAPGRRLVALVGGSAEPVT